MQRLLEQLDVAWVAHACRDIRSSGQLQHLTATWLRALAEILHTYSYFRQQQHTDTGGHFFCVMHRRYWQDGSGTPNQLNFTRFAGAAISRLLPFVDALVAQPPTATVDDADDRALPAQRLQALIQVRGALIRIRDIAVQLPSSAAEVASVHDELLRLLTAKLAKLDEAVWDTMEEVRARVISTTTEDDSNDGSSGVHRMTRSVLSYIDLLETDYGLLHRIVYQASKLRKCAPPGIGNNIGTLASLKLEMVSCLEEKLNEESRSFPNESLRYLFLLNNLHFVKQQFRPMSDMKFHMPVLDSKIDDYMQRYLQVSWAPVLSCFHSPAPLCLGRYSPLPKFESEFHKAHSTQKLWKVPDPELRRRLRKAVIDKLTPSLTEYLQDDSLVTSQGIITLTPQELEEMLQELFEG
ncbi:hypothetical protein HU200_049208 [Digitaria exilis]|uniref:Exocyst subunit Exo70 family protein n=1 Tax=Digitaria exilis TaxID=1010633 RepID=A0A835AWK7_9POAL|nr:hypothetical protein HU200_049208 [Digitaria exilis]CAB3469073.1 unnamed protein product [Digitaria exilis]